MIGVPLVGRGVIRVPCDISATAVYRAAGRLPSACHAPAEEPAAATAATSDAAKGVGRTGADGEVHVGGPASLGAADPQRALPPVPPPLMALPVVGRSDQTTAGPGYDPSLPVWAAESAREQG